MLLLPVFSAGTLFWGLAYKKSGDFEKRLINKICALPDTSLTVIGYPFVINSSIPLFAFEDPSYANKILRYFNRCRKNINFVARTNICDLNTKAEYAISNNGLQLSMPQDKYNFFFLNETDAKEMANLDVLQRNFNNKPIKISVIGLNNWGNTVYVYSDTGLIKIN